MAQAAQHRAAKTNYSTSLTSVDMFCDSATCDGHCGTVRALKSATLEIL